MCGCTCRRAFVSAMRPSLSLSHCAVRRTAGVLALLLLAGCAFGGSQDSSATPSLFDKLLAKPPPEAAAVPDKREDCGTPAQCKATLKRMVDNPKRGWVGHQQPATAYLDGTRLFAYRALRTKLTCRELSAALGEVSATSKSLAGDVPGVPKEQVSRTRALSSQVESELSKERGARCAKT